MHDLSHSYPSRRRELQVLRNVSLEIGEGEHVSLVGASGSGKTTLLSLLGGLERPQRGVVSVAGQDLGSLTGDGLARFRRETVGFVFQHFGLLGSLDALENVELALALAGNAGPRRRRRHAVALLERVGLGDRLDHRPAQLSGGERQRVAIARAVANAPRVLLADEPTGDLDDETAESVSGLLEEIRAAEGCTLVVVTHQRRLAERAGRRLVLREGTLGEVAAGPSDGRSGPHHGSAVARSSSA